MRSRSSRRAKALAISEKVKDKVWERDCGVCVWCLLHGPRTGWPAFPEAHYIPRSKGGLGIEENILTLCRPCHDLYDFAPRAQREYMREIFRDYLSRCYKDWDESKLIYRKEGTE